MAEKYITVSTYVHSDKPGLNESQTHLEELVNEKIKEGYSPLGGPCFIPKHTKAKESTAYFIMQAMIKND